jgi:hypothetical protein
MSDYKFISLEDEIDLRRSVRAVFKHEGWVGVLKCMGEISRSLEIVAEVAQEIDADERKAEGK